MQKCKNAEMILSRSCDAIAHTSHEMHSAPLAKCEEKEEAERRRHDQFLSWCVAKGTSMSTERCTPLLTRAYTLAILLVCVEWLPKTAMPPE